MLTLIKGAALWMPTPHHRSRRSNHLYVARTDPASVSGYPEESVLLVSVSTDRNNANTDPACILNPGDHEAITRRSYVSYRYAIVSDVAGVHAEETRGRITSMDPIAPHVLERICAGLKSSPRTAPRMLAFYREAERLRLNP